MSDDDTVLQDEEHDEIQELDQAELQKLEEEAQELQRSTLSASFEKGASEITNYLRAFPNTTPLSYEEFLVTHAKWKQTQAQHLLDFMVYRNIRLVVALARKYYSSGMSLLDLIQEGIFGLITAIKRFDSDRGLQLSTLAYWWIKHSIHRALENSPGSLAFRLPSYEHAFRYKLRRATAQFRSIHARPPTDREMYELLYSEEERNEFDADEETTRIMKINISRRRAEHDRTLSFDAPTTPSKDGSKERTLGDTIESSLPRPDAHLLVDQITKGPNGLAAKIRAWAREFSHKERTVYYGRFIYGETLREVGERLDLSRERVRQVQNKIIARFARRLRMEFGDMEEVLFALGEMKQLDIPELPPLVLPESEMPRLEMVFINEEPPKEEIKQAAPAVKPEPAPKLPKLPKPPKPPKPPRVVPEKPKQEKVATPLPAPIPLPLASKPPAAPLEVAPPPPKEEKKQAVPTPKVEPIVKQPKSSKPPKPAKLPRVVKVRYPFSHQGSALHEYPASLLAQADGSGCLYTDGQTWMTGQMLVASCAISEPRLHMLAYEKKVRYQPGLSHNGLSGAVYYALGDVLRHL